MTTTKLKRTNKKGFAALLHVFETRRRIWEAVGLSRQAVRWWEQKGIPVNRRAKLIEAAKQRGWILTDEQLRGDL